MQIIEKQTNNYISLFPQGDLDANSSVFLDEKIRSLLESENYKIHISGKEVPYISSAGLGVLISHMDEVASHQGKFVISDLNESVSDVFEILGLDQLEHLIVVGSENEVEGQF